MRAAIGALAVSLSLLAVPAAQAETEVYFDRDHGVRFIVDGPVLTVRLEPPDIREDVWGRQIRAACSPVFTFRPRKLRRLVVTAEQLWPDGQLELSYTFERDISDRVKWCVLEDAEGGEDLADAGFAPFVRIYADNPRDRQTGRRLRAFLLKRAGSDPWFPETLAIQVDDGMTALIATTLRRNARGRASARRLCTLVARSGVATGRTAVYGRNEVKLRSC